MPLPTVEPDFQPTQAVIADVQDIEQWKDPKDPDIIKLKVSLQGRGSGGNATVWLSYHPIFFSMKDPKDLLNYENGAKLMKIYENNFITTRKNQMSQLQGCLSGNRERLNEIGDALQKLGDKATPEDVITVLKDFLITREYGRGFGCIISQKVERKEDENGEVKFRRTTFWQLNNVVADPDEENQYGKKVSKVGYWRNDAKGRKNQITRAEKSQVNKNDPNGRPWFVVTFDADGQPDQAF